MNGVSSFGQCKLKLHLLGSTPLQRGPTPAIASSAVSLQTFRSSPATTRNCHHWWHRAQCSSSDLPAETAASGGSTKRAGLALPKEVPCLPFTPSEVLVPGQTKTLHLYEARYLALLDEALAHRPQGFCHVVIESVLGPTATSPGALACNGLVFCFPCLVSILKVQRERVGASVTIRGETRGRMVQLSDTEPYMRFVVAKIRDNPPENVEAVLEAAGHLRALVQDVLQLEQRLSPTADSSLLQLAMDWADDLSTDSMSEDEDLAIEKASRLSFAALQEMPAASPAEQQQVLRCRLNAMDGLDLTARLHLANDFLNQSRAVLAAKAALHSLKL